MLHICSVPHIHDRKKCSYSLKKGKILILGYVKCLSSRGCYAAVFQCAQMKCSYFSSGTPPLIRVLHLSRPTAHKMDHRTVITGLTYQTLFGSGHVENIGRLIGAREDERRICGVSAKEQRVRASKLKFSNAAVRRRRLLGRFHLLPNTKTATGRAARKIVCMAPQLCVMNPAQGSPPSAAPGETSPENRVGTDTLDLSPARICKTKRLDLPFSVESLISDRSLSTPESDANARTEENECASPRELYRSKPEVAEHGDKESSWFQAPYASPSSECRTLSFILISNNRTAFFSCPTFLNCSGNLQRTFY